MSATVTPSGPTPLSTPTAGADPGLSATIRSEWSKLVSARAPRRNLLLGVVLGIGLSVLLAVVVGATFDEWSPTEQADFDPILYPLSGSLFIAIFFAAVGVNVVASEYTSGMIRLTMTATPRRERVLYAKVIAVSVATWVAGVIALAGMLLSSQFIFSAYDLPTTSLSDGDLWRTVVAIALLSPLFPLFAVALTFLLRSTAAALSTVLALIFAPSVFGGLLPGFWQRNIISLLPGPASDSVALGHLSDSQMYLQPVLAGVVLVVWVVVALAFTRFVLNRRDA